MNLLDRVLALSWQEILFAACLAYMVTYIVRSIRKRSGGTKEHQKTFDVHPLNMPEVYERCKVLFPIESIEFHGKRFQRGMMVKIITLQKNVIEGELIGMNRVNLLCIRAGNRIIAHQLEKIEEITAA